MATTVRRRGSQTGESSRRFPRPLLFLGVGLLGVLLAAAALLVGLRLARPGALPSVEVAGVDVGGLGGDELRRAVTGAGRGESTVIARRGDDEVSAAAAEIGYALDVEATVDAVLAIGRQPNPFTALRDHLRAFTATPIPVELVVEVHDEPLSRWVTQVADTLTTEPVEGTLVFEGDAFERVDPVDGGVVEAEAVRELTLEALLGDGEATFEVPVEAVPTETTVEEVDHVAALAERALSAPVTLRRGEGSLTVAPAEIGGLLEVRRAEGGLQLDLAPAGVAALAGPDLREALESEPVDARFELTGGAVRIVPSQEGFRFDEEIAATQLLEVATGTGPRDVELEGHTVEPGLSTTEAEALEIVEQVSSFTTHFQCCQSRVTNIQRIADLVRGALILPGETLSVNDHVGPRTVEKGFAPGGAIFDGEFVEQIGGGVSQFATTMYNAAFFGGYAIPDAKRHSYYISRYPVGREATLNYPNVDLKVRNNSPHGLLVDTSYTGTSITVTFWGKKWVEVSDITGERRNVRPPPTQTRENAGLAEGATRVVQSGREGFDITVVRVLRFPDGREEREEVFTRYLPEPRVVEVGTRRPDPPPQPPSDGDQDDGAEGDQGGDGGDGGDGGGGDDPPGGD